MERGRGWSGRRLVAVFLLALLLLPSVPSSTYEISTENYNKLVELSARLEQNNSRLLAALESSKGNVMRLEELLEEQRAESRRLKADLEKVRSSLENSQNISQELERRLLSTVQSLRSLEQSLDRLEQKVKVLKASRFLIAAAAFIGGVLAGGAGWQIFSSLLR